jgi:hypothetical protein
LKQRFVIGLFIVAFGGPLTVSAQYETERQATIPLEYFYVKRQGAGLRKLLSKLTFGVSTGAGVSYFKHSLTGLGIQQNPNRAPLIFSGTGTPIYSNWFNTATTDTASIFPSTFRVQSDTTELGFKGRGLNIPLKATIHYEWKRYRIGGGYSYEYLTIGDFRPTSFEDDIGVFSPAARGGFMRKYFGLIGVALYRYEQYLLVVDAQIGGFRPSKAFNLGLIQKGVYYNVGATIERDMSEYLRLFVRPSFELKNYTLSLPETGQSIKHRFNALYLNVGVTYRIPELRRCFLKDCRAQINHAHGNKEYRSRIHPIYKKQNPHYGENHPNLIKYKGKNKRKLNPY